MRHISTVNIHLNDTPRSVCVKLGCSLTVNHCKEILDHESCMLLACK